MADRGGRGRTEAPARSKFFASAGVGAPAVVIRKDGLAVGGEYDGKQGDNRGSDWQIPRHARGPSEYEHVEDLVRSVRYGRERVETKRPNRARPVEALVASFARAQGTAEN